MIDIQILRNETETLKKALKARNNAFDLGDVIALDQDYRQCLSELEALSNERNKANDEIAALKKAKEDASAKLQEMKVVSQRIGELKAKADQFKEMIQSKLLYIPNIPSSDTPVGKDAKANKVVSEHGEIKKFSFKPKSHMDLANELNLLDFERSAKLSGSSFILFKGLGAKLERALINFMLDMHTGEHGYQEVSPPFLVKRQCMQGTGQLPKFEEDMYRIYRGSGEAEDANPKDSDLFLIPTAEVPITNIHQNEILKTEELPKSYVAYTPCFRLEAGAYGKDTKGMIRVHQFDKVELVKFSKPEDSANQHEELLSHAKAIFDSLGIPYRVVLLSSGDLGFSASKCYDIEVWAPGINQWLEASSCSNFGDFQARRAAIRYKDKSMKKPKHIHTLNGSGVALARTFVALLENFQQADGSILIPEPLRPYMSGATHLQKS